MRYSCGAEGFFMLDGVRDRALNLAADLLRLLFAPALERRCRRCLVAASADDLAAGLCGDCRAPADEREAEAPGEEALRAAIAEAAPAPIRSPLGHDAIVLNSGGKDSLYMLVRLRRDHPRLRLLSVSFDNGFLNALSLRNIDAVCAREGVDSLIVRPDPAIYRALIGRGLAAAGAGGGYRVDCMDGAVFRDLASKLAVERGIGLVFAGHTCAQTRTILGLDDFRMPRELLARDRTDYFGIPVRELFGEEDGHVWKGSRVARELIPHWLFPMHVWRPSQREIEAYLAREGFATARVRQYATGNALQALFMLHDRWRLGRSSYEAEAAIMLRRGLVDRREWRRIHALIELAARSRRLTRAIAQPPLRKLGLDFDTVFGASPHDRRRTKRSPAPAAPDPRVGARH